MKNISFLLLFSCFFGFNSHAQKLNYNKDYLRAEELFGKGKYLEVLPILEELDSTVDDPNVDYLIGMTLKSMKSKESEAIPYLEKYVASSDSLDQAYFFLAELYHWNYRFDDAINMYERFEEIALPKIKDEVLQEFLLSTVSKRIAECNYGKISISDPRKVIIENCGPQINSEFPEYAPVISNDENRLIYTARNSNSTGGKKDRTGAFFEDIYYTELLSGGLFDPIRLDTLTSGGGYITLVTDFKYEAPKKMWGGVNKKGHDGAIQLTLNEDSLYFYRNSDIWISSMSDTLSEGKPVKFDFVNSSAYEPSVYLSSNGQTIYVSSEREGGFGGLDLYESHKLPDGSWTPLENLGPKINTPYDEDAPYIDPDGITVYFSSKGHSSMGGYDVFKTIKDPVSGWQDIENMGYPVNTPGDDIYYVMTPKYNRAYYSSDNLKGYGDMDIYRLTFADERHPMAELKGLVLEGENYVPAKSKITMLHSDSSILSTFVSDSSSGQYLVLLGHGKQYDMLVQTDGFMPYKKKFTIPEQKEYYQLYQEIHHIHLLDNFGNIIGQQVVIYNSFEDEKGSDTTSIFYDQRTKEQLNRIINLREGDRVDVYSDILFYLGKDSIAKILAEDTTLSFNFPSNTSISFLMKDGSTIEIPKDISELSHNILKNKESEISLNEVGDVSELDNKIDLNNLEGAPTIILYFEYDKTKMIQGEHEKLNLFANYLEEHPEVKIQIIGHTDSKGTEVYNQQLSENRAKQVMDYLSRKSVVESRMKSEGRGELEPSVSNTNKDGSDNPENRQLNRRVEFILSK